MFSLLFRPTLILLSLSYWFRILFLFIFYKQISFNIDFSDWLNFFFTSFRFDMMVVGYIAASFLLFSFFGIFIPFIRSQLSFILKTIFSLAAIILTFINILDVQHYQLFKDRINSSGLQFLSSFQIQFDFFFWITTLIYFYFGYSAYKKISRLKEFRLDKVGIISWLFAFLFTAVVIRSSFGEHHLDLRNVEVTKSDQLNIVIIPSAYAFDQALRNRR